MVTPRKCMSSKSLPVDKIASTPTKSTKNEIVRQISEEELECATEESTISNTSSTSDQTLSPNVISFDY